MRFGVVGLALLVFVASLAPSAALTAPRPVYAEGDFWLYSMEGTLESLFALNGSLNLTVEGFGTFFGSGTDVPFVTVLFEGRGTLDGDPAIWGERILGTWVIQRSERWQTDGYEVLQRYQRILASGTGETSGQAFTLEWVNSTHHFLLRDTWAFPLGEGDQGTLESEATSFQWINVTSSLGSTNQEDNGTSLDQRNFTAVSSGPVTVPAGTWEALRINESFSAGRVEHDYAPAIGGDVRQEVFNGTGASVTRLELLSYRYQGDDLRGPHGLEWTFLPWLALAAVLGGSVLTLWGWRRRKPPARWRSYEEEIREERAGDPPGGPGDPEGARGTGGGSSSAGTGRPSPGRGPPASSRASRPPQATWST